MGALCGCEVGGVVVVMYFLFTLHNNSLEFGQ